MSARVAHSDFELNKLKEFPKFGHYVWDVVKDKCIYCSEEHARIHGMAVDEYLQVGSTANGIAHPADREIVTDAFNQLKRGAFFDLKYRIVLASGQVRWIHELGQPVFDQAGKVVQEIGTSQEVGDNMAQADKNELLKQDFFRNINVLPVGIAVFDSDHKLRYCNQKYRDFLPLSQHLLSHGMPLEDLLTNSAGFTAPAMGFDDKHSYIEARIEAFKNPDPRRIWQHKQSIGRWIRMRDHPHPDGGFISIIEDATDEVEAQEEARQAQKMYAIGSLTSGIAHDFNNLLTVIQGNAELLEIESTDDTLLSEIISATRRGAELTKQLLQYSRESPAKTDVLNLDLVLDGFAKTIRRTLGAGIKVEILNDPRASAVRADQSLLEIALFNLAINSKDAMRQGGTITITTEPLTVKSSGENSHPTLPAGQYTTIRLADTGDGMAEAELKRAKETFFSTKKDHGGTGLGLPMVDRFVRQSGGTMSITSTKGVGTEVSLVLPQGNSD